MLCAYHPQSAAAAQCIDCNKGLCHLCASLYSLAVCGPCQDRRIAADRRQIYTELGIFAVAFIAGILYGLKFVAWSSALSDRPFLSVLIIQTTWGLWHGYIFMSVAAGWQGLSRFTSRHFLFLPIAGWLIYFMLKFIAALFFGLVYAPIRLVQQVRRLRALAGVESGKMMSQALSLENARHNATAP